MGKIATPNDESSRRLSKRPWSSQIIPTLHPYGSLYQYHGLTYTKRHDCYRELMRAKVELASPTESLPKENPEIESSEMRQKTLVLLGMGF